MKRLFLFSFLFLSLFLINFSYATSENSIEASPIRPWSDFKEGSQKEESSTFVKILLWPVNRVLDLIDMFKFDVGIGPSLGAVVRVTKFGQVGYRQMIPASLRVGNFGRTSPIQLEYGAEIGAGPLFAESSVRNTCPGEVGAGADLFLFGVYGGICLEEVLDFASGLFFIDLMDDDIK